MVLDELDYRRVSPLQSLLALLLGIELELVALVQLAFSKQLPFGQLSDRFAIRLMRIASLPQLDSNQRHRG